MSNNTVDAATLAQLHTNYLGSQKQSASPKNTQKKGNFLTDLLPALGGGLGAVAGIPLDVFGGAGSIAGGAAGSSLGEALKEHLLGQGISAKQVGIQGLEGGALSAFNPLKALGSASKVAKGFVTAGADTGKKVATDGALAGVDNSANSLADQLVTQGQQAQGRVAGTSAGKSGQIVVTPQDTARMNAVLKQEKIPIGNANNTLQNLQGKLDRYGKQIDSHFTANNSTLNPADTKTLAANYLSGLKTTDPGVLKQASVLANDLEKNVSDTKSLWEFRKTLDDRIPDTKQGATLAVSNKIEAVKGLRQYISNQLGKIPGASQYHALSDIKPLVAGEANRLNNPGGGIIGRVLASGPAQKSEATVGRATEAIGKKLGGKSSASLEQVLQQAGNSGAEPNFEKVAATLPKQELDQVLASRGIPVKYESDILAGKAIPVNSKSTLTNPSVADIEAKLKELSDNGFSVNQRLGSTPGSLDFTGAGERGITPQFTSISPSQPLSSVELNGSKISIPLQQQGAVERGVINTPNTYRTEIPQDVLQQASDAAGQIGGEATASLPANSLASQLVTALKGTATLPLRAAAAPLAYPGRSIGQVGEQAIGRALGDVAIPNSPASGPAPQSQPVTDLAGALSQTAQQPDQSQQTSQSPYSIEALQYDIQRDPANAAKYISYYQNLDKIYNPPASSTSSVGKPTAQQYSLASSALNSIQQVAGMIQQNPDVINRDATPGQGLPIVGGLVSRAAGTSDYHTQLGNIAQAILHLQTGAAFSSQEKQAVQANIPRAGDSAATIQDKLNTLSGFLSPFLGASQ